MPNDALRIPKVTAEVSLWVHPEGLVVGEIFLEQRDDGTEDAYELFNRDEPFLILRRPPPEPLRFYNRNSIVRVQVPPAADGGEGPAGAPPALAASLLMMDGSLLEGEIREPLPEDRSRLYDYLNQVRTRFIRLRVDGDRVFLVNKSYVIHATAVD